jgi:NAD(P)-dependent dehydrogenase (short-subunit alcohol dehydrogenase family)
MDFKPLNEQVILLTGATSGIGLATARMLASKGANLVLVARGEPVLEALADELGAGVMTHPADVADREAMRIAAGMAIDRWGRLDTWINNAGVAIYGRTEDVSEEEHRRLFETNYWGAFHGMMEALRLHRLHGAPNKIVTVGSQLSDRTMIYQGPYSASKHALKGITDAIRMEVQAEGLPLSITLIKPGSVDTPYMEHARNHLDAEGTRNPPVAYAPEVVARAITFACTHHIRDIDSGGIGWLTAKMGQVAPGLTDLLMQAAGQALQVSSEPPRPDMRDNLHKPGRGGHERSNQPGPPPKGFSLLQMAEMYPAATLGILGLVGAGVAAATARGRSDGDDRPARRRPPVGRPPAYPRGPATAPRRTAPPPAT